MVLDEPPVIFAFQAKFTQTQSLSPVPTQVWGSTKKSAFLQPRLRHPIFNWNPNGKASPCPNETVKQGQHVSFIVGPLGSKMLCHKAKLLFKSCIARELLGDSHSTNEIKHPDFSHGLFKIFVQYIETDQLCFSECHVPELLRLAFLYELPRMTAKIVDFARGTLSLENCVKYHLAASLYELSDLQSQAFFFMLRHGPAFLNHPSFLTLDPLTLGLLLSRDDFFAAETDIFLKIIAWVNRECDRLNYPKDKKEFYRRVCGNLFYHIRYSMMTPKEFQTLVIPTGLLCPQDVELIQKRFLTHPSLWHTLPPSRFNNRPRYGRQQISVPLYNSVQVGYRRFTSSSVARDSVRFLASQDIFLVGISFFGPARNGNGCTFLTSYKIKYQIENEFMSFYWKTPPQSCSYVSSEDFDLELPHPYKIDGQHPYKITVWFEGQQTQFGVGPLPQAGVLLNENNLISFIFSDTVPPPPKPLEVSSLTSSRFEPTDAPGVIKALLFEVLGESS